VEELPSVVVTEAAEAADGELPEEVAAVDEVEKAAQMSFSNPTGILASLSPKARIACLSRRT
jgi:hypothetical protein